ncbi:MAG TPA: hypothetical protein DCE71_08195 [Parachlamydiales bacterium]|nr:hypothetical protein [Parachlamydiales bacterium]
MVEAFGKRYSYDLYGRCIRKGGTSYLYLGFEEIASFEEGLCKTLKIPGLGGPVAIEIDGKPYAPIVDAQEVVRKLIDPMNNSIYAENHCDVFGNGLTEEIPYAYRGKRYDQETNLLYFGKRYYNPASHQWLKPNPLGSIDHDNLYQYVYNNPIRYSDPIGYSFWGYALGLGEILAGGALMLRPGFPRFRGAHRYNSFCYPQSGFVLDGGELKLSKIGNIRVQLHRPVEGKIKTCTLRKNTSGDWDVSLSCEVEVWPKAPKEEAIGIDVGLTHFATFSNGEKISNPRFFKKGEEKLA